MSIVKGYITHAIVATETANRLVQDGGQLSDEEAKMLLELMAKSRELRDAMILHDLSTGMSVKDAAARYGLTSPRISQIKHSASK